MTNSHAAPAIPHQFGSDPYIPDEADSIVEAHVRDGAITAGKLGSDVTIAATVDDVTLEINGGGDIAIKAGGVTETEIANSALTAPLIGGDGSVLAIDTAGITGDLLAASLFNLAMVDGQDETGTPDYTVSGVAVGDEIVGVIVYTTKASIATQALRTDFTAGDGVVSAGAGAADNTDNQLLILWVDKTP